MRKTVLRILALLLLVSVLAWATVSFRRDELVLTGIVTTHDVLVSPQIGGRVIRIDVEEGNTVNAGDLLALIEPAELAADSAYYAHNARGYEAEVAEGEAALRYEQQQTTDQIRQAEATLSAIVADKTAAIAELEKQRLDLERTRQLTTQGIQTTQQLDAARTAFEAQEARVDALERQAEAQEAAVALAKTRAEQIAVKRSQLLADQHHLAAADAQREKAEVRLAQTEVRAPIDGIVDVCAVRPGEVVNTGQPLLTLINPDDLWVRADIEETYIDQLRLGDSITVRLPWGEERRGTIFHRGVDAGFATQRDVSRSKRDIKTFEIRIRVDNSDRRLAVGMTAYVPLNPKKPEAGAAAEIAGR